VEALYRWGTAIVVALVVIQIGAAGFGAFNAAEHVSDEQPLTEHTFDDGFSFHTSFGYLVFIATVVLLLLAFAARRPRRTRIFASVLVVAVALQIVLAWGAESTHWVGPFHALNAFVILGLSIGLAQFAWRRRPAPTAA
jgi:heme A synthase